MSPLELEILIHYYAHVGDFRDGDLWAPAVEAAIAEFLSEGLLFETSGLADSRYKATDRLRAFVEHLCAQPLPISKWVIPDASHIF